ncbi:hypothetical protein BH11PLA2_BH11PLA2_48940 [soil metagenome]
MIRSNVAGLFRRFTRNAKLRQSSIKNRPYRRDLLGLLRLEDRTVPANLLGTTANNFAVLGGSTVTNTGPSVITGDLGVGPGTAITGFPPGLVLAPGIMHSADAVALQAQSETTTAYNLLAGLPATSTLTGQDLGGMTLIPGVYFFADIAQLTGTLTLDGQGDPNATFVFQIGSTLTTASSSTVVFVNGATQQEVYWQVGSSATLGTATQFAGNIVALTSISFGTGASISCGRALARNGAVTLDTNIIVNNCANTPGSISGRKFDDLNGDGIEQLSESGLPGVTVYLDANSNNIFDAGETSVVCDVNGFYTFPNLPPGTDYLVREVQQSGLLQTTTNPLPITLTSGQNVTGINFGDFRLVSLGGQKFNDLNGNGVQDVNDTGVAGVTVFLDANGNGNLDNGEVSTVTDANGNYALANVGPGTFRIREVQPAGTVQTTTNPADVTTSSGSNISGIQMGNFSLVSLGGLKFSDLNGNGIQDANDTGLAGITVFLDANGNGTLDAGEVSTVSDANGNFVFANVGPGTFRIRQVQPVGTVQTSPNPSDIITSSGSDVGGVLFADFLLVSLGGLKFNDLNGNGIRDTNDTGVAGVVIFLDANGNGTLDAGEVSTITDVNGNFIFPNVGPGTYLIRELQPPGTVQTTVNPADIVTSSGSNVSGILFGNFVVASSSISGLKFNDLNGNGIRDANDVGVSGITVFLDANGNDTLDTGEVSTITDANGNYVFLNVGLGTFRVREVLPVGTVQTTVNPADIVISNVSNVNGVLFGNFSLVSLGGLKFNDLNGNGIRDANDNGVAGITVFLDANDNGTLDAGEVSTVTDANGNYVFTSVGPGTFRIREVQPTGTVRTTANPTDIVASSGTIVSSVLLGNFQLVSLGGLKFNDLNGNGIRDANDTGVSGVTIFLDTNGNGNLDAGEISTVTDANGNYLFTNVGPGTFRIREVQPAGTVQTSANPADIMTSSGSNVGGVLFGNFGISSISGLKFNDFNGNGIRDANDTGVANVTVFLDTNGNGTLDAGEVSTQTDANGNFIFPNVGPGTYLIREVQPLGTVQTTVNPANIVTSSGTIVSGVLLGNFQLVSLGGLKFNDLNGNGIRDANDTGVAAVTMFLDANGNNILDAGEISTVTDASGNYLFTNVGPGTFRIREVQPSGTVQTSVIPADIVTSSGSNVNGVLLGNFQLVSLGGLKFNDLNGNGIRDTNDSGVAGVTMFLDANGNGTLDSGEISTVTDVNGNYLFTNVGPGIFRIREVQPSGTVQTSVIPADIVTNSGSNVGSVLLGNFAFSSISGLKFNDHNGNGIRDVNENGVAGFTVFLDSNANGTLDAGEVSTVTDANGNFAFANIVPGAYRVREVNQLGWIRMTNNPPAFTVTSGVSATPLLFGNAQVMNIIMASKLTLTGQNMANNVLAMQAQFVADLYEKSLGRAPDLAGLNRYMRLLQAGFTPQAVADLFQTEVVDGSNPGGVGQLRVVGADFNGDGILDYATTPGKGVGPRVIVFNGADNTRLFDFFAYEPNFTGGVNLAAADITGDGKADIILGTEAGGGARVRVLDLANARTLADFFAYDSAFRGGVRVATGDFNGDGVIDVLTGAGSGGGPRVSAFNGVYLRAGTLNRIIDFFAMELSLRNGVFVAAGDFNNDGIDDIVTGSGAGGAPRVRVFDTTSLLSPGAKPVLLDDFFAGNTANRDGIRVSVKNVDGDARPDLVTSEGLSKSSRIRSFSGASFSAPLTPTEIDNSFLDFDNLTSFNGALVG